MSSWGRLSAADHDLQWLADRQSVPAQLQRSRPGLAFGSGRSYGDVCLNPGGVLWSTARLDRFIAFDADSGRLRCEPGVRLCDIETLLRPRGWALAVTPGTRLITVGGAVANDVHGKNHHRHGSFGDHLLGLRLVRSDGRVIDCGPERERPWFEATIGGLGLTGVLTEVELQLQPSAGPWLDTETLPFHGLDAFFALSDAAEADWDHTVAWIDCLSGPSPRGLFLRGRPAADQSGAVPPLRRRRLPFTPPLSLVNRWSLRPFNAAYFRLGARRPGVRRAAADTFLYPLDGLDGWNRMYGPAGFFQYQSVVPRAVGRAATQALLDAIGAAGEGSFLAVLKTFGERQAPGLLSFPCPGVTLALDFPNRGARTERLFERLDAIVSEAGGRLYPAKDARMPRRLFEAGYPRLPAFVPFRDPGIRSAMSQRLFAD